MVGSEEASARLGAGETPAGHWPVTGATPVSVERLDVMGQESRLPEPPLPEMPRCYDSDNARNRDLHSSLQWMPDESEIVFSRGPRLYGATPDGTRLRVLIDTSRPAHVGTSRFAGIRITHADVSADGSKIVYSSCRVYAPDGNDPEVYACLSDRKLYVPLTSADCSASRTYGERTVTIPTHRLFHEIAVWDSATGETALLVVGHSPVWSPGGARIAFASDHPNVDGDPNRHPTHLFHQQIYTMATDGSDIRRLTDAVTVTPMQPPRWSPDGRRLAFVGEWADEARSTYSLHDSPGIFVVDADGSNLRRLTDTVSNPTWSPSGRRIAFAKPDPGERFVGIHAIDADGAEDAQRITTVNGWRANATPPYLGASRAWIPSVAWSPGGSKILYTCGWHLCVVDLSTRSRSSSPSDLLATGTPMTGSAVLDTPVGAWSGNGTMVALGRGHCHARTQSSSGGHNAADGSDGRPVVLAGGSLVVANEDHREIATSNAACAKGFAVERPTDTPGLVRDCETLLELRKELFGDSLVNWGAGTPIDAWVGVAVSGSPPRVTGLTLRAYLSLDAQAEGLGVQSIPAEGLAQLPHLQSLVLHSHAISGPIPATLGRLASLQRLELIIPGLSGPIPAELTHLSNLRSLSFAAFGLTGGIPPEIGSLANLERLRLWAMDSARFSGSIPAELGHLVRLQFLDLQNNNLTGSIPATLARLANLEVLLLDNNQLSGPIPAELGQLARLRELDLRNNRLTGTMPAELGQLPNLERINVRGNLLRGCVPAALQRVPKHDFASLGLPACEAE